MKKLNLAIIGQGRSGKDIHGLFYRSEYNTFFNVKYVVDADERRRNISKEIYPGCETFADYRELFDLTDVDVVVNASYSQMHYPITKDLLEHGFNVLVEKPLARNHYECEDLIKTAKDNNAQLFVFQQSFFAPFYLNAKRIIAEGLLGEVKQIDLCYSGFKRRWDWQTLQKKVAGNLFNTGPHPVGLALGFLDFDKNTRIAFSRLYNALASGDADDSAKLILEAPGKPFVDIEINSNDAYAVDTLKILGTRGTLTSTLGKYELTYVVDGENPEKPVVEEFLQDENGNPLYCSENLITHKESGEFDNNAVFTLATGKVYEEMYYAITEGKPMTITPEIAMMVVSIIDGAHSENPMPLIF